MTETVIMDANGCVALPQDLRDALRLPGSASFHVAVADGRIELTPVPAQSAPSPRLKRKNGRLVVAATGQPFDAVAAINEIRESRL